MDINIMPAGLLYIMMHMLTENQCLYSMIKKKINENDWISGLYMIYQRRKVKEKSVTKKKKVTFILEITTANSISLQRYIILIVYFPAKK